MEEFPLWLPSGEETETSQRRTYFWDQVLSGIDGWQTGEAIILEAGIVSLTDVSKYLFLGCLDERGAVVAEGSELLL